MVDTVGSRSYTTSPTTSSPQLGFSASSASLSTASASPSSTASPSRSVSDLEQMLAEAFGMFDDTTAALPQSRQDASPLSRTSPSPSTSTAESFELFPLDARCVIGMAVLDSSKSYDSGSDVFTYSKDMHFFPQHRASSSSSTSSADVLQDDVRAPLEPGTRHHRPRAVLENPTIDLRHALSSRAEQVRSAHDVMPTNVSVDTSSTTSSTVDDLDSLMARVTSEGQGNATADPTPPDYIPSLATVGQVVPSPPRLVGPSGAAPPAFTAACTAESPSPTVTTSSPPDPTSPRLPEPADGHSGALANPELASHPSAVALCALGRAASDSPQQDGRREPGAELSPGGGEPQPSPITRTLLNHHTPSIAIDTSTLLPDGSSPLTPS